MKIKQDCRTAGYRINEGYRIIDSVVVGGTEFVLGKHQTDSQYVTWECVNGNNYYNGNYMTSLAKAVRDLRKRVQCIFIFGELRHDCPEEWHGK